MKRFFRKAALILIGLAAASAMGQNAQTTPPAATLHIGDSAPPIVADAWPKGQPIESFAPRQTYLIVFWSTWCAAFLSAMEHMDELAGQFGNQVQMVAVSVFESNRGKVYDYVHAFGDKMDFPVAADKIKDDKNHGLDGAMARSWLEASGQSGLPIAFIVDGSGKIAWIGSPVGSSVDEPLRRVADGTWDTAAFAEKFNSEQEKSKQMGVLATDMQAAIAAANWDQALKDSDQMIPYDQVTAASARYLILLKKGDFDSAYAYCRQLADGPFARDARGLYSLGWVTLGPDNPWKKTDYDLALDVLKKAADLTYQKNPEMLDALAWAYYDKGDKASAAETERLAITVARIDQMSKLKQNLKTFEGK